MLGIISIESSCFLFGIVGLFTGIIGLVLGNKDKGLYAATPEGYTESSMKLSKAGRVCSIIGIILSALAAIFFIIYVVFMGAAISALPWEEMSQGGM